MNLRAVKRIHMIGIGGSGLSAIARLLLESGYQVSGSDRQISPLAVQVREAGAQVVEGHAAQNVHKAELVIRSSAIPEDNVEVQEARRLGIPVLKRADFLGALMQDRTGIAVAGTHGKTTTTAMLAWILTALGLDPTFIIGGVSQNLGLNAHAGKGEYFVIEADEYDRMFLGLRPNTAVITNIEHDHPDCYPQAEDFYQAFVQFARLVPASGSLVVCADDPGAARLAEELRQQAQVVTYGIERGDQRAFDLAPDSPGGFAFSANLGTGPIQVRLQVPGVHNVRNALAALLVVHRLALDLEAAAQALAEFSGAQRRFDILGEAGEVLVVNDYGHHPTEIEVNLSAARVRYPGRRLWAVWQPHTYSRTRTFLSAFGAAFRQADQVVVTDIYPSREPAPADGFSARQVVQAIQHPAVHYVPGLEEAGQFLCRNLRAGDVLIVFSAGDADQISRQVLDTLNQPGRLTKEQPDV